MSEWRCLWRHCAATVYGDLEDMAAHLRVTHPDADPLMRWPDGTLVVDDWSEGLGLLDPTSPP